MEDKEFIAQMASSPPEQMTNMSKESLKSPLCSGPTKRKPCSEKM
jgi:hypothetical protein